MAEKAAGIIVSASNPRVKNLTLLQKKAKERKRQGVFVAEGIRMFREAPKQWITDVYASESFFAENRELIQGKAHGRRMYILSDTLFTKVSDTETPQGILCVLRMPGYRREDLLAVKPGAEPLLLILEGIQDPGNLGTLFRSAEGAGATGILVSADSADLFNPKTVRSTMGSIFRMPFCTAVDLRGEIASLKKSGLAVYAAQMDGGVCYDEPDYRAGSAFLVGNEGNGLTEQTAALADRSVRIPMAGQLESLNAAVSGSLLLFEAARQRRGSRPE